MSERQEGPGWWMASDGKWYPPESHPDARAAAGVGPGSSYASFGSRLVAWIIDSAIIFISLLILTIVLTAGGAPGFGLAVVAWFAGFWLYYALQESGEGQATVGKRAMGIKVTDAAGMRLSFGRATGRVASRVVTHLVPFAIGYLMALFTERKQALHDLMAGTLVVKSR